MKTKRIIGAITFLSLLLCVMVAHAQNRKVVGSNRYITKEIKLANFDEIKLLGSPTVIYTQATNGKSQLNYNGSNNLFECLEYRVVGHVLEISFKRNTNIQFNTNSKMEIRVSSPSLKAAFLQGSGDIILNGTVKTTNLDLVLEGSGDITATNVVCSNKFTAKLQGSGDLTVKGRVRSLKASLFLAGSGDLDVSNLSTGAVTATLQGSGDMGLSGTTQQADLNVSHSGSLNAERLKAVDVKASLQGSGDISCYVSKTLWSSIRGSGSIGYKGSPKKIVSMNKKEPRRL